jgi:hypothetical protein
MSMEGVHNYYKSSSIQQVSNIKGPSNMMIKDYCLHYLKRSLELLNKSSIVFFIMVRMKGLLELKFLGICCVYQKKMEGCALRSLRNGIVRP